MKDEGLTQLDSQAIESMTSLQELDVSGNSLSSFPDNFMLGSLKKLNIGDNSISDLTFLSAFPNLEELVVTGNPLDVS